MNRRHALKLFSSAAAGLAAGRPLATLAQAAPAFTLPPLGYAFDALEPHIDATTMKIHHDNHHNAYVTTLNAQVAKFPDLATKPLETFFADMSLVPEAVRTPVRNSGGGHWNHTFFWNVMTPGGAKAPAGDLKTAIDGTFGGQDKMVEALTQAGMTRFGSGWAWLAVDKDKKLKIFSTANQDTPHMEGSRGAVIGVDVWEHAYYLKHQSRRAEYLKAWFGTVNWDKAAESFKKLTG